MERQAIASGHWDRKANKEKKGWSSHDIAVIVALKHGHGLPNSEDTMELYEEEFPRKKRSDITKMVQKMQHSGDIDDLSLLDELSSEERRRLGASF